MQKMEINFFIDVLLKGLIDGISNEEKQKLNRDSYVGKKF